MSRVHLPGSDEVQRQNSADVLSTYWTFGLNEGLVAVVAAAHMSTVHDNTVTWLSETNSTVLYLFPGPVVGVPSPFKWALNPRYHRWLSLLSLKFPPFPFQLPPSFSVVVIPPTDPQKDRGPQQGRSNGQPFTPKNCIFQVSLKGEVHETQEVLWPIRGRLKTDGSIRIQYQLPCTYKSCSHL